MQGSSAVVELVVREEDCTPNSNPSELIQAALDTLAKQVGNDIYALTKTSASHHARIGLLASVHKLLLRTTSTPLTHSPLQLPTSPEMHMKSRDITDAQLCLHTLLTAVLSQTPQTVAHTHTAAHKDIGAAGEGPTESEQVAVVCASSPSGAAHNTALGSSSSQVAADRCGHSAPPRDLLQQELHQLRALIVMVQVQLNRHHAHITGVCVGGPSWTGKIGGLNWLAEIRACDAELADTAQDLLSLPPRLAEEEMATAFKRECVAWDAYALRHFHGRLLPGCSYLGCTNTCGTSEATLGTLLCSGCKRMKYCSVGCQRAAWAKGGHSDVCGSGGWVSQGVRL